MRSCANFFCGLLMALILLVNSASGQDAHFTQFHRIPTWYNPASAGENVEHIRLTMLYRNQWSSIGSPYKTQSIFFDKNVGKFGFGVNLVNNSAGDAGIRQLYLNGQLAYRLRFGSHYVGAGLQVGMIQKSFDPSKMTFDDQYTPDQGYDPSNPTSESFSYTKLTRPDMGAGIEWSYGHYSYDRFHPYVSIAVQHLNEAKESFILENNTIRRKVVTQAGLGITVNDHFTIVPQAFYATQQSAKEMIYGVKFSMPLQDRNRFETALHLRQGDAAMIYAGYQYNSWMLGMSYDVNTSKLTNGPGGFELTLTYIPKAKEKKEPTPPKKKKDPKEMSRPGTEKPELGVSLPSGPADRDGDGVPDSKDGCPDEPGSRALNGCPFSPKAGASSGSGGTAEPRPAPTQPATKVQEPTAVVPVKIVPRTVEPALTMPKQSATISRPVLTTEPSAPAQIQNSPALKSLPQEVVKPENQMVALKPHLEMSKQAIDVVRPAEKTTAPAAKLAIDPSSADELQLMKMRPEKVTVNRTAVPTPDVVTTTLKVPAAKLAADSTVDAVVKTMAMREATLLNKRLPLPSPTKRAYANSDHAVKPEVVTDSDKDGIADDQDACPYIAGTKATHGCPDTDNDGITDSNDPCPYQAGEKGSNGCPVTKKADAVIAVPASDAVGNIEFKTGSDQVKGIYKLDIIEPVLDSLYYNEQLVLVLTGHTDGEGDAAHNMVLSQQRIDAVKAIFVKKGLHADRIVTVPYGETMPLRENTTEDGRARNRRVEIRIMKFQPQQK